MVLHLILTTLAGEEAQLTIELQEYDRLQEFENAVLEQLPKIGESSTFGCVLDFVCRWTNMAHLARQQLFYCHLVPMF